MVHARSGQGSEARRWLTAGATEHDLIAVAVFAHGEVGRFAVFGLRRALALAACCDDLGSAYHDVDHLKGEPGPGALAFAAAVDRDQTTSDFNLSDVRILSYDGSTEAGLIKVGGALCVSGPDCIF